MFVTKYKYTSINNKFPDKYFKTFMQAWRAGPNCKI